MAFTTNRKINERNEIDLGKANRVSNKLKRRFAQITDLPEDLIMGLSKMVLLGKKEFYIENYNGIKEYENNKINVKTINGDVIIEGDNLSIEEINDSELIVRGVIKKILLEGEE